MVGWSRKDDWRLLALTAVVLSTVLLSLFLATPYVVCFGISCLEDKAVSASDGSRAFVFHGEHCFETAEMLRPSRYAHVKYPGFANNVLNWSYFIYPDLRFFIVPSKAAGGAIVSVSSELVEPREDLSFCATDFRLDQRGDRLVIKQPTDARRTKAMSLDHRAN